MLNDNGGSVLGEMPAITMGRAEKTAKCKGLLKQAAKTWHGRVERTFHHYTNDKEFPEG